MMICLKHRNLFKNKNIVISQKGITLTTLVVTIIILLILSTTIITNINTGKKEEKYDYGRIEISFDLIRFGDDGGSC